MTLLERADELDAWLSRIREWSDLRTTPVPLLDCAQWRFGNRALRHDSGKFFSVLGMRAAGRSGTFGGDRVMIDQPEVGWLGYIVRPGPQGIEWLVQAKTEPGNIHDTQIAPSIQATRSNYLCLHGGRPTEFLDLFRRAATFASDGPHSEQGTRFLWKFNRNSVLVLSRDDAPDVSGLPQWEWCSTGALRDALGSDFRVNTDARSVIATAPWALLSGGRPLFAAPVLAASYRNGEPSRNKKTAHRLAERLRPVRPDASTRWQQVALDRMKGHEMTDMGVSDAQGQQVLACYRIDVNGREVDAWCQPFLLQAEDVVVTLLMRVTGSGAEFLLRPYQEFGFGTRREFGPTLHSAFDTPQELADWLAPGEPETLLEIRQSDEGGRFMQVKSTYRIALIGDVPARSQYAFGNWVPLSVLEELAARPGTTTNELRTLVSMILGSDFDRACAAI